MKLITGRALYTGYTALTREEETVTKCAMAPGLYRRPKCKAADQQKCSYLGKEKIL
jgi:hypothetical protein